MSLFTVNTAEERNRGRQRVRLCQRWDFADSIFTHQTELFPVSTWQNSCSQHLRSQSTFVLSLPFSRTGCLPGLLPFHCRKPFKVCFTSPTCCSLSKSFFWRSSPLLLLYFYSSPHTVSPSSFFFLLEQCANIRLFTHPPTYPARNSLWLRFK